MRVLFFVEPFPVRNSMTHFQDIAKRAVALCAFDGSFDMRVFANAQTLQQVGAEAVSVSNQPLLWPTVDEEKYFRSQLVHWEAEGISLWSECMRGGPASAPYRAVLERLRFEFPFDVLVHWGENGAVSRFVSDHDLPHIAIELGCARKPFLDSYVFDPMGTNGAALVPRLSIGDIERIVGGRETSAEASVLGYSDAERSIYDSRFALLPPDLSEDLMSSGRKVAFLALQLYDDANLIQFSHYADLREVVLDVVPKLAKAGYTVLVKPHPSSRYRPGASEQNDIARAALAPYSENVVWFDDPAASVPNSRLMQVADLVVTVNSSVGFEALYFDKIVVVLGEAVYKPERLFPRLDQAISGRFDRQAYRRNIGLLRTFFLDAYLVDERWVTDPKLFAHRVSTLVGIQRTHRDEAFAQANALYAAFAHGGRYVHERALAAGSVSRSSGKFEAPVAAPRIGSANGFRQGVDLRPLLDALRRASSAEDASSIKNWLQSQWADDDSRLKTLRLLGSVEEDWYAERNAQVKNKGRDASEHFCKIGEQRGRIPSSLIDPHTYAKLPAPKYLQALYGLLAAADSEAERSIDPLSDAERDAMQLADEELAKLLERPRHAIAVVAHAYYADLVDPLLDHLAAISEPFDLIVSVPLWGARGIQEKIKRRFGDAVLLPLPNRGRDVAPFLHVLPTLIRRDYDAVLKIQTKKGYYQAGRSKPRLGSAWREYAWNCLAGSAAGVREIVAAFRSDGTLSMAGPEELLVPTHDYPVDLDRDTKQAVGLERFRDDDAFFAGTMFWLRPVAFSGMTSPRFAIGNFNSDPENSQGELEHAAERLFGHVARTGGYRIAGIASDGTNEETRLKAPASPNRQPLSEVMERLAATSADRSSLRTTDASTRI